MNSDDKLRHLERRVEVLETLIRQLTSQPGARPARPTLDLDAAPLAPPGPAALRPRMPAGPPPPIPAPVAPLAPRPAAPATIRGEQWFGQRGLLALGVVCLILAAGYLLKLSFERGWISPPVRCAGGVLVGLMVGGLGWRLESRRLRTYGASLIGGGAAVIYLSLWAAVKLYTLMPPMSGILALALVSLGLGAIAYALEVEGLASAAVLGAFFAPILLGQEANQADALLVYLAFMGAALGWVAQRRRWRVTTGLIALCFFGVGALAVPSAAPERGLLFTLLGGSAGVYLGLREDWWETRFLSFSGAWSLLGWNIAGRLAHHWPVMLAGVAVSLPVWRHALRSGPWWPFRPSDDRGARIPSLGEALYFFVTPFLLAWALHLQAPAWFDAHDGALALCIGLPYVALGYQRPRVAFALVGTSTLLLAVLTRWSGLEATVSLLGLAVLWAGLDHLQGRTDGRWYALLALGSAVLHLYTADVYRRPITDSAFLGSWALTLWLTTIVTGLLAGRLWIRPKERDVGEALPGFLWILAGTLLLSGGTGEIVRYFNQSGMQATTAELASGLSVSAWWLVFAAGLLTLGFRRDIKNVRIGGFVVLGFAVMKVFLVDLSSLDALYRVGSVFLLSLVSLSVAYVYHRRARDGAA